MQVSAITSPFRTFILILISLVLLEFLGVSTIIRIGVTTAILAHSLDLITVGDLQGVGLAYPRKGFYEYKSKKFLCSVA